MKLRLLTVGLLGLCSFAAAAGAPWLDAPDVRKAEPGTRTVAEIVDGVDVYAWPHNETSTGVSAPIDRVQAEGALTVIDATSAAGGIDFDATHADVYYFAPQKNLGSDGGLWFAAVSPAAIDRVERLALLCTSSGGAGGPSYPLHELGDLPAAEQANFGTPETSLLKSAYISALFNDIINHPCPVTASTAPLDCKPAHPMRAAWFKNDLRTWVPTVPVLCQNL